MIDLLFQNNLIRFDILIVLCSDITWIIFLITNNDVVASIPIIIRILRIVKVIKYVRFIFIFYNYIVLIIQLFFDNKIDKATKSYKCFD